MRHLVIIRFVLALFACAGCGDASVSGSPSGGGSGGTAGHGAGGTGGTTNPTGGTAPGGASPGGSGGATGGAGLAGSGGNSQGGVGGQGGTGAQGGTGGQGGAGCSGPVGQGSGPCEFPQGVPEADFIASACSYSDTDPSVDAAVNAVMATLTGCGVSSDCPITVVPGATTDEICQSWFAAVTAELRAQGYCAGQHAVGATDEIAVSNTGCDGKWYGYHICNYGGPKVVWNPGARRGWWAIDPAYCQ